MGFWDVAVNVLLLLSFPGPILFFAFRAICEEQAEPIQHARSRNAASGGTVITATSLASFDNGHSFSSACSSDAGHTSQIGC